VVLIFNAFVVVSVFVVVALVVLIIVSFCVEVFVWLLFDVKTAISKSRRMLDESLSVSLIVTWYEEARLYRCLMNGIVHSFIDGDVQEWDVFSTLSSPLPIISSKRMVID